MDSSILSFNAKSTFFPGCLLSFPAGLSRPGKSREGPGTGPRDLEGPVVLAGQDLETLKVPGLFLKGPGTSRPLFPLAF